MKKLLIGVLVLRMENGWIQPFQTQFTIPTMAIQGIIVDVLDKMGANVLHTECSNQVQILSLLNLHFIVSFHEKSGRIIYLLKLFVFQVLNVCHSLLDTLKKHAVWSTKPTQFRHCTWPNFGQMVSITCHLCKGRLNRQNLICNWPAASTCHGELKYC